MGERENAEEGGLLVRESAGREKRRENRGGGGNSAFKEAPFEKRPSFRASERTESMSRYTRN